MAKDNTIQRVGAWAFILGVILAIIIGLFGTGQAWASTWTSVLVLLGLIVGLLNVTAKETMSYLLAAAVLVIVAGFGVQQLGSVAVAGPYLAGILGAIMSFVIPATVVVSLKQIYGVAATA